MSAAPPRVAGGMGPAPSRNGRPRALRDRPRKRPSGAAGRGSRCRQLKEGRPRMRVFRAVGCRQRRFRFKKPLVPAGDPSANVKRLSSGDVPAEADAQLGGQRLAPGGRNGLRHRLVEHRTHNAPVDDSLKTFPLRPGPPERPHFTVLLQFVMDPQPLRIILAACKTARMPPRARQAGRLFNNGAGRAHGLSDRTRCRRPPGFRSGSFARARREYRRVRR